MVYIVVGLGDSDGPFHKGWTPGGGVLSTKVVIGMCRKHGSQNQAARYINGSFFFRKCGTWMGVPVLIGTSMGHFLSLRYIDGPFFITEVHRWAIFYHWYINGS